MIKKIFVCFTLLLLVTTVNAAEKSLVINIPMNSETQKFSYNKVVEVPDTSASVLYERCKNFLVRKFSNENFAIDEADSKLAYNGSFPVISVIKMGLAKAPVNGTVLYTLTTQFKDGKYKYELTDIKIDGNSGTVNLEIFVDTKNYPSYQRKAQEEMVKDVCEKIDQNVKTFLEEYEQALTTDSPVEDNDW